MVQSRVFVVCNSGKLLINLERFAPISPMNGNI